MWEYFLWPQGGEGGAFQSQAQMSLGEDSTSHLSSSSRIAHSPARNPLSFRTMQAKVTLLDGSLFTCTVEVRQAGTGETARDRLRQIETASVVSSGPPTNLTSNGMFSCVRSLTHWLSRWSPVQQCDFVDNWKTFWVQPALFRRNGIHPNLDGATLVSTNLKILIDIFDWTKSLTIQSSDQETVFAVHKTP